MTVDDDTVTTGEANEVKITNVDSAFTEGAPAGDLSDVGSETLNNFGEDVPSADNKEEEVTDNDTPSDTPEGEVGLFSKGRAD